MITHYIQSLGTTLMKKPQLGFVSSLLSISLTHLQILQIIGAVLGIVIAVVTAILKIMELREKLEQKEKEREGEKHPPAAKKRSTKKLL